MLANTSNCDMQSFLDEMPRNKLSPDNNDFLVGKLIKRLLAFYNVVVILKIMDKHQRLSMLSRANSDYLQSSFVNYPLKVG